MQKAIGYCRVSTTHQAQEGVSLDMQKEKIQQYAKLKGLNLTEIIEDAGKSGRTLKRKGIQKILSLAENSAIDTVVIFRLDRMFRSTKDALHIIGLFDEHSIAFHSICENIDTRSAMGRFFLTILAACAELESNKISERITEVFAHKRAKGERLSGRSAPYGYREFRGKLKPDEGERVIIKHIAQLRSNGATLQLVADDLNRQRIQTKCGCWWTPASVQHVEKTAVVSAA